MRLSNVVLAVIVCCVSSCGSNNSNSQLERHPLSGAVLFDAAPLEAGSITFHPQDPSEPAIATGCVIKAGKFSLPKDAGLPSGHYKVVITSAPPVVAVSTDPIAAMDAASNAAPVTERIPARYNIDTELTCEITPNENVLSFDLKSDK